mmetsp:Transcript_5738/g.18692  ORF Transcript_5738/g.18692 Transcript_5738/m.18692 type:complete len:470 (-) Transcript_5738:274-1683(-)
MLTSDDTWCPRFVLCKDPLRTWVTGTCVYGVMLIQFAPKDHILGAFLGRACTEEPTTTTGNNYVRLHDGTYIDGANSPSGFEYIDVSTPTTPTFDRRAGLANCSLYHINGVLSVVTDVNIVPGTFLRAAASVNGGGYDDNNQRTSPYKQDNDDSQEQKDPQPVQYMPLSPERSSSLEEPWPPPEASDFDDPPEEELQNPQAEDILPGDYTTEGLYEKVRGPRGFAFVKYDEGPVRNYWASRKTSRWTSTNSGSVHEPTSKTIRRQTNFEDEVGRRYKPLSVAAAEAVATALRGYKPTLLSFLYFDESGGMVDSTRREPRQWAHQDYDPHEYPERNRDELAVAFFAFDEAPTYVWVYPGSHLADIPSRKDGISIRSWGRHHSQRAIALRIPQGYMLVAHGLLVHMGRGTTRPRTPNPRGHAYLTTKDSKIELRRDNTTKGRQDPYETSPHADYARRENNERRQRRGLRNQ